MTDEAMSPLRRRMIEDMTIRKLAPKTQQGYIRTIKSFAAFVGRSPDTATFEDVRRFQLHLDPLRADPYQPSTAAAAPCADLSACRRLGRQNRNVIARDRVAY
jgi:hypothetical protein